MIKRLLSYLKLVRTYIKLNFSIQREYVWSYFLQIFATLFSNSIWIVFWAIFFGRTPDIRGWDFQTLISLWALNATGFGLFMMFFGNTVRLSQLISEGQIDVWLTYPRSLIPHIILGQGQLTALGDVIFGIAIFVIFGSAQWNQSLLLVVLAIGVCMVYLGFNLLIGSFCFLLRNATLLSNQLQFSLMTFSTYPFSIFTGVIKIVLFFIIPAGLISYLPVRALINVDVAVAFGAMMLSIVFCVLCAFLFRLGLRNYESGNLSLMRG